jgi:hypothetical protein
MGIENWNGKNNKIFVLSSLTMKYYEHFDALKLPGASKLSSDHLYAT